MPVSSVRITWTRKAEDSLQQNLDYLQEEWGENSVLTFLDRVDEVVALLQQNPLLFPSFQNYPDVHWCVVHQRITLFYRLLEKHQVDLLLFWNNYQNPDRLKLIIPSSE